MAGRTALGAVIGLVVGLAVAGRRVRPGGQGPARVTSRAPLRGRRPVPSASLGALLLAALPGSGPRRRAEPGSTLPRRRRMRCAAPTLAATLVVALGACGGGEQGKRASDGERGPTASGQPGPSGSNGPVVAHSAGSSDGASAMIEGPLTMSKGCLLVGDYPVVWPHGTTWDADQDAVILPDGQVAAVGDRVSGGGGYPYLSDLAPELADPLADCPTNEYGEIAAFNASEQITVD